MRDIYRIAETVDALRDTTDVAIANGTDHLALNIICRDIKTSMKMIGTRLTKIPRQRNVIIYWRGKYT